MTLFFENFADEFFFAVASIVSILVFLDWLLGEEKRISIREWVGSAWLHLGEARYREMLIEDIRLTRSRVISIFGTPAFSVMRLIRVIIFTVLASASLIAFFYFWLPRELPYSEICWDQVFSNTASECPPTLVEVKFADVIRPITDSIPTWAASLFFSISFTIFCMKKLYSSGGLVRKFFFFALDVFISLSLVLSQWIFYITAHTPFMDFGSANADKAVREMLGSISFILICLPTLTYITYLSLRTLLKISRPIVFPPVMLLLLRFHQSRKGVLTNLAVFIGAAAKLGQQFAKTFLM